MRVMLDTNVLISAFVFDSPTIGRVIRDVATKQQLVLCTFVVDEFREVVARKWPARRAAAERFLERASYETVVTPEVMDPGLFEIRDPMDYPVVYSALLGSVDVLVTGDKDFGGLGLESPVVVTPAGYVEEYL